jgi:ferredoxin
MRNDPVASNETGNRAGIGQTARPASKRAEDGVATTEGSAVAVEVAADRPAVGIETPATVWVDQDLCTGDGLCVQYAPDVFEFDIDGLAYVKTPDGQLLQAAGARVPVPTHLRLDVIDAARDCPGECIHVCRAHDGAEIAGPDAT